MNQIRSAAGIRGMLFWFAISFVQTYIMFFLIYPEYYINGDNEFYDKAYYVISSLDLREAYSEFHSSGGSGREPISFLFMYVASKFVVYETYFLVSNFLFTFILGYYLFKSHKNWLLAYVLVSFSFYVFIGSNLTQRLSVAIVFWLLSECASNKIIKYSYVAISIASHFQMIATFLSKLASVIALRIMSIKLRWLDLVLIVISLVLLTQMFGVLYSKVSHKLTGVHYDAFLILVWPILLMLAGLRLKLVNVLFFITMLGLALFISSGRLNIICFFYCLIALSGKDRNILYFMLLQMPYGIYQHINYFDNYYLPGRVFG